MLHLIHTFNTNPATGIPVLLALAALVIYLGRASKVRKPVDLHGGCHDPHFEIKRFRGEA